MSRSGHVLSIVARHAEGLTPVLRSVKCSSVSPPVATSDGLGENGS